MAENTGAADGLKPHWLKGELERRGILLTWLSMRIDVTYPKLLGSLSGRQPMDPEVEERIRRFISENYRDPLPDGEAA